jgi:hypothetical protein
MPEIEITPEQEERLRTLQEDIARDVVGKYGHVRPRDAVEYLLDRYEEDGDADAAADTAGTESSASAAPSDAAPDTDPSPDGATTESGADDDGAATAHVVDEEGDPGNGDGGGDGTASSGGDDAMLNEMMSLLDTHDDKWGESGGDERYEVTLPDGTSEQVRTKDDVKALLFEHYR